MKRKIRFINIILFVFVIFAFNFVSGADEFKSNPSLGNAFWLGLSGYDVLTPGLKERGPRRIVVGKGGEIYYTENHYKIFVRIS